MFASLFQLHKAKWFQLEKVFKGVEWVHGLFLFPLVLGEM